MECTYLMIGQPFVGKHIIIEYLNINVPAIITAVSMRDGSWVGVIEWAYA